MQTYIYIYRLLRTWYEYANLVYIYSIQQYNSIAVLLAATKS